MSSIGQIGIDLSQRDYNMDELIFAEGIGRAIINKQHHFYVDNKITFMSMRNTQGEYVKVAKRAMRYRIG